MLLMATELVCLFMAFSKNNTISHLILEKKRTFMCYIKSNKVEYGMDY